MRHFLFVISFLMGSASAAIYAVVWTQKYQLAFGHPSSMAFVAALCFAGVSIGSLIGARMTTWGRPVRHYAWAEIALAFGGLWAMVGFRLSVAIDPHLYRLRAGNAWLLMVVEIALAMVAVGPAAVAMGTRLPLLIQGTVTDRGRLARQSSLLHAMGIIGLATGAALMLLALPMVMGIGQAVYLAVSINLLVGIAALVLAGGGPRERSGAAPNARRAVSNAVSPRGTPVSKMAAAISGASLSALVVLHTRLWHQQSDGSILSISIMLIPYLGFLAAGSLAVAQWLDGRKAWRWMAWTQAAAILAILVSPHSLAFLVQAIIPSEGTYASHLWGHGIVSSLAFGPPAFFLGMALPCTWKTAGEDVVEIGKLVGELTAYYALAAAFGIFMAGRICLPLLGLDASMVLVPCLVAVLAVVGFWQSYPGFRRWAGCLGTVGIVALWSGLGVWRMQSQPTAEGDRLLSYRDGQDATVSVIELRTGHRTLNVNGDHTLGSSEFAIRDARRGRLPMLLHSNPNRVAIIGITTGVVASAVLDFPVQRVVAVDQLPSVVEVLPYFDRWNRSFYKDDRVELVVGSGRSYLLGTDQQFDLMIGDPIFPARSASADLCTVEHFQLAHQRLAPGGILVQWLSAQQWSTEELRTVAASMLKVFPTVTLWRADFDIQQPILGLIAYHDTPAIDRAATSASCARLAENNTLPAPFLSDPASAQMLYVCGDDALREWAQGATLNTDNRPVIAYATPKNFVQDRARNLQGLFDFLAQIRPRKWCYDETIAWQPPADTLLRAADLVDDASIAATWNNFEQEYRIVRELAQLAGEVPIVAEYIVAVAARYRSRQMTMRSTDLLTALVQYPDPPLAALLALAEARNLDGEDAAAITLMERGVAKAPNRPEIRRRLVQWLKTEGRYDQAEPHLLRLVGALPNDPYIRLDLAHVLDRQGKSAEAREQVDAFKERWNGEDAKTVWRYMRRLGLGGYATTRPPEPPGGQSMTEGTDAPPDAQEKNLSGPDEDE